MVTSSDICAEEERSGDDSGGSGGDERKMCTSDEQNVEHCKKDGVSMMGGVSTPTKGDIKRTNDIKSSGDNIDDIADGIGMVGTGCIDAAREEVRKGKMKDLCLFCRVPNSYSDKEDLKRCRKRMKLKDAYAIYELGDRYYNGRWGLPQHLSKACELWKQAAELGSVQAHCGLGDAYMRGAGVEQDAKKARYHWEIAAMRGHENARHGLGGIEEGMGNSRLGMHHIMFAARSGYDFSMKAIGEAYKMGDVTKDEYAATLRAYKESYDEMESVHRAASAAIRKPAKDIYALSPEERAAHNAKYTSAFEEKK